MDITVKRQSPAGAGSYGVFFDSDVGARPSGRFKNKRLHEGAFIFENQGRASEPEIAANLAPNPPARALTNELIGAD